MRSKGEKLVRPSGTLMLSPGDSLSAAATNRMLHLLRDYYFEAFYGPKTGPKYK